jgi:hypothetical protein
MWRNTGKCVCNVASREHSGAPRAGVLLPLNCVFWELPPAYVATQVSSVARKINTVAINLALKCANVSRLSLLQSLRAPRLKEPAVAQRPVLASFCGTIDGDCERSALNELATRHSQAVHSSATRGPSVRRRDECASCAEPSGHEWQMNGAMCGIQLAVELGPRSRV